MNKNLKIEIAQINFTVGDLDGNTAKIIAKYEDSKDKNLDLIIFSELAITGYPPEDLLHKPYFIKETEAKINEINITDENSDDIQIRDNFVNYIINNYYNNEIDNDLLENENDYVIIEKANDNLITNNY